MRRPPWTWAAASLVLAAACSGAHRGGPEPSGSPDRIRCEPALVAAEGFTGTETSEEVYADHVGVRLGFWDGERQLHVLAGIPGEVGEGLPIDDVVAIVDGPPGRLLGSDRVWVLAWETSGPCANNAVLGDGFTREGFTAVLVRAGVIDAQDG